MKCIHRALDLLFRLKYLLKIKTQEGERERGAGVRIFEKGLKGGCFLAPKGSGDKSGGLDRERGGGGKRGDLGGGRGP